MSIPIPAAPVCYSGSIRCPARAPADTYAALLRSTVIAVPFLWPKLPDYRGRAWSEMTAPSRLHTCYAWSRRSGRPCAIDISADGIDSTNAHFMANELASTI